MSRDEKISFILKNELEITMAVQNGHRPHDGDKYKDQRGKIKEYRKEVFGNMLKNKIYRSVNQIF
jgi:hypothetical protein